MDVPLAPCDQLHGFFVFCRILQQMPFQDVFLFPQNLPPCLCRHSDGCVRMSLLVIFARFPKFCENSSENIAFSHKARKFFRKFQNLRFFIGPASYPALWIHRNFLSNRNSSDSQSICPFLPLSARKKLPDPTVTGKGVKSQFLILPGDFEMPMMA